MQKSNPKTKTNQPEPINSATQIFSKSRDIDVESPYHLDGNLQMYNEQNIEIRDQLAADPDIKKQIKQIIKFYQIEDGKINEKQYKRVQRQMAIALRPQIDEEQLQFVVDQDWQLDQTDGFVVEEQMGKKIFELVDVWTMGTEKLQYISFIKLLKKKVGRGLTQQKS